MIKEADYVSKKIKQNNKNSWRPLRKGSSQTSQRQRMGGEVGETQVLSEAHLFSFKSALGWWGEGNTFRGLGCHFQVCPRLWLLTQYLRYPGLMHELSDFVVVKYLRIKKQRQVKVFYQLQGFQAIHFRAPFLLNGMLLHIKEELSGYQHDSCYHLSLCFPLWLSVLWI